MREQEHKPELTWVQKFNLFSGVIMPAISISVEASTHVCAETFFDPIPTTWHLVLVVFVPLAQLQVWFAIRRGSPDRLRLAGWLNAISLGISVFYSFVYLPLLPLAALVLLFGLGLLPLAPFLSLLAAILMRVQLKRIAARSPKKIFAVRKTGLLTGLGLTVLLIGAIELPASLTRYGLRMASSPYPETRAKGIQFLRSFGSRDYLLRACYSRSGLATDVFGYILSFPNPVEPAEARKIYYRVTGETFDTSAPPKRQGARWQPEDSIDFDRDQGDRAVGSKLKGLSLASSKLDGSVDANGGVGYIQWTLKFRNDSPVQREARAEVQLPPGAVVSRLTLWVNGEEREAAFASRGKVTEAYQQVVRQRRDPVLVTTAGRDQVLVQCFPVPPNNGEMQIRFGITVPLLLEGKSDARLVMPHFASRNFRIPDDVDHLLWIESETEMKSENDSFIYEIQNGKLIPEKNHYVLRGNIADAQLSKPATSIVLGRSSEITQMWSKNPFESNGFIIRQSVEERVPTHLKRIVLVVDTSASMRQWVWEILAAMQTLPREFDVKLVLADSNGLLESHPQATIASGYHQISSQLQYTKFEGGADNATALNKAWELAAEAAGTNAIVWIHAPQLLELKSVEELKQRWLRRPYGPRLYSVKTAAGADEIERQLDGINEVRSVARTSDLKEDLEGLFARLTGQIKTLEFVRTTAKAGNDLSPAYQTSDHLARLWANEEVTRILTARDESLSGAATTLAVRYQLVTSVSGAVVLESEQQYRDAQLKPVDAGTVPTIPEPEMLALLGVVIVFLSWLAYRQHRTKGRGGYPV